MCEEERLFECDSCPFCGYSTKKLRDDDEVFEYCPMCEKIVG